MKSVDVNVYIRVKNFIWSKYNWCWQDLKFRPVSLRFFMFVPIRGWWKSFSAIFTAAMIHHFANSKLTHSKHHFISKQNILIKSCENSIRMLKRKHSIFDIFCMQGIHLITTACYFYSSNYLRTLVEYSIPTRLLASLKLFSNEKRTH